MSKLKTARQGPGMISKRTREEEEEDEEEEEAPRLEQHQENTLIRLPHVIVENFRYFLTAEELANLHWARDRTRVYMERDTSRIWSHNELEDVTFPASNLGFIRPESIWGRGNLCLLGEEHVVFKTEF